MGQPDYDAATLETPENLDSSADEVFVFPASFAQQRLWFLDQLEPGYTAYNVPTAWRLTGPLNVTALQQSLSEIVKRHEVLRTTFGSVDGRPSQIVSIAREIQLPVTDLSALTADEREAEVSREAIADARRSFDLARGPLLRVKLLRLGEEHHVLLLATHHIVADGWSLGVLMHEMAALYNAFISGQPSPLPDLPVQYADYTLWQHDWLSGAVLEAQLAYWKQHLANVPLVLELPTDYPRPAIQSHRGASLPFKITADLTQQLKQLGQQEGATLFMLLLAAFQVLLFRYTGETELVVGTPMANRRRAETEGLIGFFVNTLALRTSLAGEPSWKALLQRVREATLGAFAHQDFPFEKLVEELLPERELSHHPLLQVSLSFKNASQLEVGLTGLKVESISAPTNTAIIDVSMLLTEAGDGLEGGIVYSTDLFEEATVSRMSLHFQQLLEAMIVDPEQAITLAQMLTDAERSQLLVEWNQTPQPDPLQQTPHMLFEAQADRTPQAIALTYGQEQLSYQELDRRANQLAHYLKAEGVGPEVLVGVCVERSFEMIIAVLAIFKAGGAYVPLDPTYPAERLSFMIEDAGLTLLLTQESLAENLPATWTRMIFLDTHWQQIAEYGEHRISSLLRAGNLAYVIYTSGSTGRPKGVMISHESLTNLALAQVAAFDIGPESRVLQFASFSFDASVWEFSMSVLSGATLCLAHRDELLPGADLLRLLRQQAVSCVTLPPSGLSVLGETQLPALRTVIAAGEECSAEVVSRWASEQRPLVNAYGPTEVTVCASYAVHVAAGENGARIQSPPHIGRPLANTELYILDEHLQLAPVGVLGQLYVGGTGLARGYLHQPALTAEKFIPHPYTSVAGARLYVTGDVGRYLKDGNVEYVGRVDEQVKIRGYRIELEEIQALLNEHESVRQAVVMARADGVGEKRLVAYVVAAGETASGRELREYLAKRVPGYMVPSVVVVMDEMPLTPNGKVDRRALPAPEQAWVEMEVEYVAPRSAAEEVVAEVWKRVLGIERVGVYDNFFVIGGHSLLATQVLAQIRAIFQVDVPVHHLFQTPTVESLVNVISQIWGQREIVEEIAETYQHVGELSQEEVEQALSEPVNRSDGADDRNQLI